MVLLSRVEGCVWRGVVCKRRRLFFLGEDCGGECRAEQGVSISKYLVSTVPRVWVAAQQTKKKK